MKKRGPSMKTYHGHHYGAGVEVEETVRGPGFEMKRQRRPLDPRLDLANHSPSGFAWGDGGSGPAQLAPAVLADLYGEFIIRASNGR